VSESTAPGDKRGSLWRERDFLIVWSGSLVSEMGDQVTLLALPLAAVLVLHAGAFQLGALRAAASLAFLLIALPAGILVDRRRKRPLMIAADLGRLVLIGSVPAAAALNLLSIWQLYAVALGAGILSVIFDVSYQSFVPALVGRDRLHEGNAKMALPSSFANVVGPATAGGLVALAGAARAMTADAVSFAVGAAATALLKIREAPPEHPETERRHMRAEIAEGLRYVFGHPVLRRVVACTATANFFSSVTYSIMVLYLLRDLHADPARIGAVLSLGSFGGLAGGLVAGRLARWIGTARMLWLSKAALGWITLAIPLARPGWGVLMVSAGMLVSGFSAVVYNVAQVSYRQSVTPPRLLGRMNASIRWVIWGTMPLGALLGGWLGTAVGLRATVAVGVVGSWLAVTWIITSPLIRQKDIPIPNG
jgi:MFS family permease